MGNLFFRRISFGEVLTFFFNALDIFMRVIFFLILFRFQIFRLGSFGDFTENFGSKSWRMRHFLVDLRLDPRDCFFMIVLMYNYGGWPALEMS